MKTFWVTYLRNTKPLERETIDTTELKIERETRKMAGSRESGLHAHLRDEQENMEDVKRENFKLLLEIAKLCHQRNKDEVENIFLLGKPGAGKSALINTVVKVVAGKYIPMAQAGVGARKSKTLVLERFQYCGVTKEDLDFGIQSDIVEKILPKLPTIFDVAGRDNPETYARPEGAEEILELFIGGFIPPNTSIESLEQLQKDHGVGCLRDTFYTESKTEWKMTKVVFVQSCRDTVPSELIRCLDKIIRKTDPRTAQPKYPVDVFVVITKYDLVKDPGYFENNDCPDDGYISMEAYKEIEDILAKEFSIQGCLRDNMIRWTSYHDRNASDDKNPYENPYIDNTALKFLKRMVTRRNKKPDPVPPVITQRKLLKLKAKRLWNHVVENSSVTYVTICALMIIVAILLFKLLNAPPT